LVNEAVWLEAMVPVGEMDPRRDRQELQWERGFEGRQPEVAQIEGIAVKLQIIQYISQSLTNQTFQG
jgi:hypothetical protein